jgi:cellulose synthase (UDP-forming)
MSVTQLWHDIGAGETFLKQILRFVFLCIALVMFLLLRHAAAHLAAAGGLRLAHAADGPGARPHLDSYLITLTLMILSLFCDLPLRLLASLDDRAVLSGSLQSLGRARRLLHHEPGLRRELRLRHSLPRLLSDHLAAAPRAHVPLPETPKSGRTSMCSSPPTTSRSSVVRYTALGALNIDWPADKLHVYILDDGRREEFRSSPSKSRHRLQDPPDNFHAKAGNINTALKSLTRPTSPSSIATTCPRAAFCR